MDLVNRNNPAKLGFDLLDHLRCARGYDRNPAQVAGVIDFGHGQAVDVVATPRKEADHAGQNAGFIFNQNRKGVAFNDVRKIWAQIVGGVAGRAFFDF